MIFTLAVSPNPKLPDTKILSIAEKAGEMTSMRSVVSMPFLIAVFTATESLIILITQNSVCVSSVNTAGLGRDQVLDLAVLTTLTFAIRFSGIA